MENNGLHAGIYQRALASPGVVVLHDAVLHHFLLGQLNETGYADEFVYNYGEWNRGLARELWRSRAASGADSRYFSYPMLRRVVERAATELARRTTAVLRVAFLASSALEWVSTFAIGLVAMYVGATLLGYFRVTLLPFHLGAQDGVFVLLLAPAYFASADATDCT